MRREQIGRSGGPCMATAASATSVRVAVAARLEPAGNEPIRGHTTNKPPMAWERQGGPPGEIPVTGGPSSIPRTSRGTVDKGPGPALPERERRAGPVTAWGRGSEAGPSVGARTRSSRRIPEPPRRGETAAARGTACMANESPRLSTAGGLRETAACTRARCAAAVPVSAFAVMVLPIARVLSDICIVAGGRRMSTRKWLPRPIFSPPEAQA